MSKIKNTKLAPQGKLKIEWAVGQLFCSPEKIFALAKNLGKTNLDLRID